MQKPETARRPTCSAWALLVAVLALLFNTAAPAQARPEILSQPDDVPKGFVPATGDRDYTLTEAMVPMRDGVRLYTVIVRSKHAQAPAPILLTRLAYDSSKRVNNADSPRVSAMLPLGDEPVINAGYIRVYQDIRGRYKSEGPFVMTRPLRGALNPAATDESTDAWDTIEWLVRNVLGNNGRVGITGTSYNGFTTLMALVDPHPALKVAVPVNPMVDGWIGDDWFRNGAFRLVMMDYIYNQTSSKDARFRARRDVYDDYEFFLRGSAGEMGRRMGLASLPFWQRILSNPAYSDYWRLQAMDRIMAAQPLRVPTMFVHGLYDQEDIYGGIAAYRAMEPKDLRNDMNYLVLGPWHHAQSNIEGSAIGPIRWGSDTALYFREKVLQPFLDHYLKSGPPPSVPPVLAFETGRNEWRSYQKWPFGCEGSCSTQGKTLYLTAGQKLSFVAPSPRADKFSEYVSDPSKPVPYRIRPIRPMQATGSTWRYWLVDDQRSFSDRPDVLTFVSDELTEPLTVSGEPVAHLHASTSGSDSDWVVKIIDLYPGEVPAQPELGGYQLMVSSSIFRGRYRKDFSSAEPIPPHAVLPYKIVMPHMNHAFLPGHRIMVQIQSSWFPVYDRNPQTFVSNIFEAKPSDYRRATQRIYHGGDAKSMIELPLSAGSR